jgi:hypothetical protein
MKKKLNFLFAVFIMAATIVTGCSKSGGGITDIPTAAGGSTTETITGTWTVSSSSSYYTIGDTNTTIIVPAGVYINNSYSGSINVTVDSGASTTVTGEFSGSGTITFEIPTSSGGKITVTLTGNGTLPPAVSVKYKIVPTGSTYTVGTQAGAISTGSAIIVKEYNGALNVALDASGNGAATGTFSGIGTITFSVPSGVNGGSITVTLTGNGDTPTIPVVYTISSEGSYYTVGSTQTAITIPSGVVIVNPVVNQSLNVQLDASGNGSATGTFSGTGTITVEVPSGVNGGKITVTLTGNGDALAGGSGTTDGSGSSGIGDPVVDNIKLLGFESVVYRIKETGQILEPGSSYYVETSTYGVITISGKVKNMNLGDKVVVRVKDQESNVSLNSDGTFSQDVVLYNGDNYVTLIQRNGDQSTSRSDIIKVRSAVGNPKYQFQLSWDGYGDVDIHAEVFQGSTMLARIYYKNLKIDAGTVSGYLDVDNTWQYGPENIRIFKAPSGSQIKVYLDYYYARAYNYTKNIYGPNNTNQQNYTLKVFNSFGELVQTITGSFSPSVADKNWKTRTLVGTFTVN